jgi:hypothetical protein
MSATVFKIFTRRTQQRLKNEQKNIFGLVFKKIF